MKKVWVKIKKKQFANAFWNAIKKKIFQLAYLVIYYFIVLFNSIL